MNRFRLKFGMTKAAVINDVNGCHRGEELPLKEGIRPV